MDGFSAGRGVIRGVDGGGQDGAGQDQRRECLPQSSGGGCADVQVRGDGAETGHWISETLRRKRLGLSDGWKVGRKERREGARVTPGQTGAEMRESWQGNMQGKNIKN